MQRSSGTTHEAFSTRSSRPACDARRLGDESAPHEHAAHEHHDHCQHAHTPAAAKAVAKGDPSQVEYTCPMHPQVRQMGPGNCPICGMALEPVLATAEQGESPELRDMTKRFWIGTALTVPVFALEMGGHLIEPEPPARAADCRTGFSCCWARPWCYGPAGHSSCGRWRR